MTATSLLHEWYVCPGGPVETVARAIILLRAFKGKKKKIQILGELSFNVTFYQKTINAVF